MIEPDGTQTNNKAHALCTPKHTAAFRFQHSDIR